MAEKASKSNQDLKSPNKDKISKKALREAEEECYRLLERKKQLDKNLINLETSIYDFETSYFENTASEGNIVRGFEGYLTSNKPDKKRQPVKDWERIFSHSSVTFKNVGL
ncbi:Chromatin modification- protein meaf6 [Mycoemilia scoparia]|uniref:Chromatin modification-related protein EAF6 n=1 Tax=Mycoemilia scoparia TaxID=417184 RepID=A0A9W8A5I7_9FUNG|nr:Chromatin modification- protein meaf6 [Mycoemilia scoparia]